MICKRSDPGESERKCGIFIFYRCTGVFKREIHRQFQSVWSHNLTPQSLPPPHLIHCHLLTQLFFFPSFLFSHCSYISSHKSLDKWTAHRCFLEAGLLLSCPRPPKHGNGVRGVGAFKGGGEGGSVPILPSCLCQHDMPTSFIPAQQDTVPPDDWDSSHNHSPGSRSRRSAVK